MTADLHIHTTASDGTVSPAALPAAALAQGLAVIAVTDHDTVDGSETALEHCPPGLRCIRGIEFSCAASLGKCHILGYGFDPADPLFRAALETGRQLRMEKLARRLAFLEEQFGIVLTEAERTWLYSQRSPGKPHLGGILMERGLAPDRDTAIARYIDPCRGGADRISAETAIRAITHAGGIPVWAHPLGGEGERRLSREAFEARLAELTAAGIRGLECCYSRYDGGDIAFLLRCARDRGLLVSGGSDYHGTNKRGIALGQLNRDGTGVDAAVLTILDVV